MTVDLMFLYIFGFFINCYIYAIYLVSALCSCKYNILYGQQMNYYDRKFCEHFNPPDDEDDCVSNFVTKRSSLFSAHSRSRTKSFKERENVQLRVELIYELNKQFVVPKEDEKEMTFQTPLKKGASMSSDRPSKPKLDISN